MKLVRPISVSLLLLSLTLGLFGYQRVGRQQRYYSYGANVPSEFYWSRLQYNTLYGGTGFRSFGGGWSQDYPKADNDCLIALRRLTRINSPSPLNVADLDSDHLFDYP